MLDQAEPPPRQSFQNFLPGTPENEIINFRESQRSDVNFHFVAIHAKLFRSLFVINAEGFDRCQKVPTAHQLTIFLATFP
jgi:hypothetical protein